MSRVEKKNIRKKRKIITREISIETWVEEKGEEGEIRPTTSHRLFCFSGHS